MAVFDFIDNTCESLSQFVWRVANSLPPTLTNETSVSSPAADDATYEGD